MSGRAGRRTPPAVLIGLAGLACANEQPPPGALPDARPPEVARFVPARDSVVPGYRGSAKVRFDEPVRLGGDLGRRIRASPAYRYDVNVGFSEIEIRPQGGWREGAVYCFEIPQGISDLLNNRTDAPIPFCFSTGPPVLATRVEGRVEDRLTGVAAAGARVLFLGLPTDTTPYTAEADPQGEFSLRALPPGGYWAYAFLDRNRSLRLERTFEAWDSVFFELDETLAVPSLLLGLLEPDSTPPVLVGARAHDSLTVRLEFDDALAPEQPTAEVAVRDSAGVGIASRLLHIGEPASLPRSETGETDEAETGEAGAEREPAAEVTRPAGEAAAAATARRAGQERVRPARVVTVLLAASLKPGSYTIEARGFRNLRELLGGGDTSFVYPPQNQR